MILVTGHRGFIGSHLCQTLKEKNLDFVGYDLVEGDDIRDLEKFASVFRKNQIQQVIHLAALAGVRAGEADPDSYITTNITGTNNLLRLAKENRIKHVIFFSSSSIYGDQNPPNSEIEAYKPRSIYGFTKVAGEMLMKMSTVPSTIVRPFTVYGENGRAEQVVYKWLAQIKRGEPISFYGDGTTKRGYTYVGDLIEGVLKILERGPKNETETYNLGGREITSLEDLLQIFQKNIPQKFAVERLPMPGVDIVQNWADISKAEKELGYNPDTNFAQKIGEIIDFELK